MSDPPIEFDVEAYLRYRANPKDLLELAKGKTITLEGFGELDGFVIDAEKKIQLESLLAYLLLNTFVGATAAQKREASNFYLQFVKIKRSLRDFLSSESDLYVGDDLE
jgi:hypothetical protein